MPSPRHASARGPAQVCAHAAYGATTKSLKLPFAPYHVAANNYSTARAAGADLTDPLPLQLAYPAKQQQGCSPIHHVCLRGSGNHPEPLPLQGVGLRLRPSTRSLAGACSHAAAPLLRAQRSERATAACVPRRLRARPRLPPPPWPKPLAYARNRSSAPPWEPRWASCLPSSAGRSAPPCGCARAPAAEASFRRRLASTAASAAPSPFEPGCAAGACAAGFFGLTAACRSVCLESF